MRAALAGVMASLVVTSASAQEPGRGMFILVHDRDTSAVERFSRSGSRLESRLRLRNNSATMSYSAQIRPDGSIATLGVSSTQGSVDETIDVAVGPDQVGITRNSNESTDGRLFTVHEAVLPYYGLSMALVEQLIAFLKVPLGGTKPLLVVRLGGLDTLTTAWSRPSPDSIIVTVGGTSLRLAVDRGDNIVSGVTRPQGTTIARYADPAPLAVRESCDDPGDSALVDLKVPGNPFQALPSADGCWVFVSLSPSTTGWPSAIGLLRRAGGRLTLVRTLPVEGDPQGMALTHDGKLLLVAAGRRLIFIDVARFIFASASAALGYLDDPAVRGRILVNVTPDDRYAFVSDEFSQQISVIDLVKARAAGFSTDAIAARIPAGELPVAVEFSRDGQTLYSTSERVPGSLGWPIECRRDDDESDTTKSAPAGGIQVIDVGRALRDPATATVGWVRAGCIPVRLVLSPDERRVYVTARRIDSLLVYDTGKLRDDPRHALIAAVPTGTAPVGIAVIDGGRRILVTASNRFTGGTDDRQILTVIDAARIAEGAGAVIGRIPVGAFPRELHVTADGRTLFLTNYASLSVSMIDLGNLRMLGVP